MPEKNIHNLDRVMPKKWYEYKSVYTSIKSCKIKNVHHIYVFRELTTWRWPRRRLAGQSSNSANNDNNNSADRAQCAYALWTQSSGD